MKNNSGRIERLCRIGPAEEDPELSEAYERLHTRLALLFAAKADRNVSAAGFTEQIRLMSVDPDMSSTAR